MMYYIKVYDRETNEKWLEEFYSYYFFRRRVIKLSYSKKLIILERSNFEQWMKKN